MLKKVPNDVPNPTPDAVPPNDLNTSSTTPIVSELKNLERLSLHSNKIPEITIRLKPFLEGVCSDDWTEEQKWISNSVNFIRDI